MKSTAELHQTLRALCAALPAADQSSAQNALRELDLAQQDQAEQIRRLQAEVERLREASSAQNAPELESVLSKSASALAQLTVLQALEAATPGAVRGADALAVANRLVGALLAAGVEWIGAPGQPTQFTPDLHRPLSAIADLPDGAPVIVRIPGVRQGDRIYTKALVEEEKPA